MEASRAISEDEDEDEVEIAELGSHEQMRALAALGRLQPLASLAYLKHLLLAPAGASWGGEAGAPPGVDVAKGGCLPRLHMLMVGEQGPGVDRGEMGVAALMEEVRVLVQVGVRWFGGGEGRAIRRACAVMEIHRGRAGQGVWCTDPLSIHSTQKACGHLLADDYSGEQPAIPDPIHRLCFQQQQQQQQQQGAGGGAALSDVIVEVIGSVHALAQFLLQVRREKGG